ncbi:MAG: hypothetical protein FD153_1253 [Rhodospirillaceae bacterium]|nr:MAG: hypothetical protein FD153_1253 [Rhodospirillaceae bacterium]
MVDGRRTSMRLEPEMWEALEEICRREDITASEFCSLVNRNRGDKQPDDGDTSVSLLLYFRDVAKGAGHRRASYPVVFPLAMR